MFAYDVQTTLQIYVSFACIFQIYQISQIIQMLMIDLQMHHTDDKKCEEYGSNWNDDGMNGHNSLLWRLNMILFTSNDFYISDDDDDDDDILT